MRTLTSLSFLFAMASVVGCGSSVSSSTPGGDAGGAADTGASDAGSGGDVIQDDGGCEGGPLRCNTKDISLTVVRSASPQNTPLAGVFVRASTSATSFVDSKTDAMGVAHVLVDPMKGPYDVTVAVAGFNAVSILGVTDSIPGNIVLSPVVPIPSVQRFAATGTIAGVNPANRLKIDSLGWDTVVTQAGDTQYSTSFWVPSGSMVALRLAAIEIDNSMPFGIAVNGYTTPVVTGMPGPMTIPITMPAPAVPATQSSITIKWPSGGVFTAAATIGTTVSPIVEQWLSDDFSASMPVGLANLDLPVNGSSLLHLQTFGGSMKPDVAGIEVTNYTVGGLPSTGTYGVTVYAHTLSTGTSVDVGQIDAITRGGTNLGDGTFAVASTGYDTVKLVVSNVHGTRSTPIWTIYAPGGTVRSRGLPYMPAGVALGDLDGTIDGTEINAEVVKYVGAKNPWEAVTPDIAVDFSTLVGFPLAPMGR